MYSDFASRQEGLTYTLAVPQQRCGTASTDPMIYLLPWHSAWDVCGVTAVFKHFLGVHPETRTG